MANGRHPLSARKCNCEIHGEDFYRIQIRGSPTRQKMRKVYAKEINECSCHFSSDIHSLIWAFEVCYFFKKKKKNLGNFLKVQWLGLGTFTAKSVCSIAGRGTKIPKATQQGQIFSLKNLYQKTEGCALVTADSFGHSEVWDALMGCAQNHTLCFAQEGGNWAGDHNFTAYCSAF